jgi:uncharacterized protein YjiS (DUF1127 family)
MTYISQTIATPRSNPSLLQRLSQAYGLWHQRQALRRLDDAALRDIGVSRAQAEAEARRPVWDKPLYWIS